MKPLKRGGTNPAWCSCSIGGGGIPPRSSSKWSAKFFNVVGVKVGVVGVSPPILFDLSLRNREKREEKKEKKNEKKKEKWKKEKV